MKGLILSGGKGTRLRPLTFTTAKQLIPVGNSPILGYVLEHVSRGGIKEAGVVIASETGGYVKEYVKDGSSWGMDIAYILQEPLGLAHAVKSAREFLGDDSFVMYLGDNLLGEGLEKLVKKFEKESLDALVLLKEVENPSAFGVAVLDKVGRIVKLVEKPKEPISNLALVGVYIFSSKVHNAIEKIKPSWRGELEITDAIQEMIHLGYKVKAEVLESWWLDTGKKDDILTANAIILDEFLKSEIKGSVDKKSKINGRVKIDEGANVKDSVIRGPCIIGRGCTIENSFIGPYSSVGDGSKVIESNVEHCVILENSLIHGISRLEDSLIGRSAKVLKNHKNKALNLHIGDYSEVEI